MKALLFTSAILAAAITGAAAEPAFPGASAVGLDPPSGMQPARGFQGFREGPASILVTELPKIAFAQVDQHKGDFAQRFGAKQADEVEINGVHGFMVKGLQTTAQGRFRKWFVALDGPQVMALVTAQVPEADATVTDAAIDKALHTITFREPPPLEQRVAALPFAVGDLQNFRTANVMMGNAMLLTDGPNNTDPDHAQAHVVIADDVDHPTPAQDREGFAQKQLQAFQAVRTTKVRSTKSFDANGASWVEVVADGSEGPSEVPVTINYFLRFGGDGTISVVCVAPATDASRYDDRFKAIATSVKPRA